MLVHEKRFFATVLDVSIVMVFALLLNLVMPTNLFNNSFLFSLIYFVVAFLYYFISLLITKNRTIGLRVMSLKLLDRQFNDPDSKIILLRSLTNGVLILHLINVFYILFNKTTSTLFDEISESVIVKTSDAYNFNDENKRLH